jgi:hypothetical protein
VLDGSRVSTCSGDGPSLSVRLMWLPVTSTRCASAEVCDSAGQAAATSVASRRGRGEKGFTVISSPG